MRKLDDVDIQFIRETFPSWTSYEIGKTLGVSAREVKSVVRSLGLTQKGELKVKSPSIDWPSIWYAYTRNGSIIDTSMATGYNYHSVRYAVESMLNMSEYRKALYWNRYAHKNGREEYLSDDLCAIV